MLRLDQVELDELADALATRAPTRWTREDGEDEPPEHLVPATDADRFAAERPDPPEP
jgi:hypothetical protein